MENIEKEHHETQVILTEIQRMDEKGLTSKQDYNPRYPWQSYAEPRQHFHQYPGYATCDPFTLRATARVHRSAATA